MPLTACPDCQHQVSTAARSCPSCGRVKVSRTVAEIGAVLAAIILGAGTVAGIFGYASMVKAHEDAIFTSLTPGVTIQPESSTAAR